MPYNGDPRAQYLLLDLVQEDGKLAWQPQFQRLDYDFDRVATAFRSSGLLESSGAIAALNLRTIKDGQPWASDYQQWVRNQPTLCAATPKLPSNSTCSPTAPTNGHSSVELPISPGQL